jgi:cell division transport system ATP-binding protein
MATHDRDLIRRYPRRIVTLENGRLTDDREV